MAQNCAYTQNYGVNDETNKFFRKVIQKGKTFGLRDIPDFSYETLQPYTYNAQGMYTFDWEGTPIGGTNTHSPEDILQLLVEAKRAFEANPPKSTFRQREFDNPKPQPPPGTVIVRKIARIRPLPVGANPRNRYVGRDYFWILREEIDELIQGSFSLSLSQRLTHYHLTDNVRGGHVPWRPGQVRSAYFNASAETQGDIIRVDVTGAFAMLAPPRRLGDEEFKETGYEGTLEGYLIFDKKRQTVVELQWLAEGEHWGPNALSPDEPRGKYPLKIAFELATDRYAQETPPGNAFHGRTYLYMNPF